MAILWTVGTMHYCDCNRSTGETSAQNTSGSTVKITARTGYGFYEKDYTFEYYRYTSDIKTGHFTISNDKTLLTGVLGRPTDYTNIRVPGITATLPITENYTYTTGTFTNCTCNKKDGDTVANGDTITITANDGYYFTENDGADKITIGSNKYDFTVSNDGLTMNFAITDSTYTGDITVSDIVATVKPVEPTTYNYTVGTMSNCVCNISNGQEIKNGDTITITANIGYNFTNDDRFNLTINNESYAFTLSSDNKILSFTISEKNYTSGNITINSIKATLTPSTSTTDFLNIYLPTNDELNLLSKQRFIDIAQDSKFDYGNYILQLYRCYIPISDEYKENSTIHLANSDTEISCTKLENNVIDIECNITVSGLLYDTDYNAYLYIPNNNSYIGVDISHIFNKTLKIKLSYELYSNKCQYSLYDGSIMFDCGVFTFGSNIPFRFYESIAQTDYNYNPPLKDCCYLMIIGDTITTIKDISFEFINGDILDIDNTDISDNDYSEIIQLFNSGVFL